MAREPSSSSDITEQELLRRKDFLEFREEDVANLATINDVARRYADSVIEDFYRHLLSFEETRTFFRDPEVLQRVKSAQQEYFLRLTQGKYDLAYAQNRLNIGAIHERIGLPIKAYLGMYNHYLRAVASRLDEAYRDAPQRAWSAFMSLMKLTFLDMGLARYLRQFAGAHDPGAAGGHAGAADPGLAVSRRDAAGANDRPDRLAAGASPD